MLTRRPEAPIDFDFAKVVEASKDNPVFYVQYAHARIRSMQRKAAPAGVGLTPSNLELPDEKRLALVKLAAQYPRTVGAGARPASHTASRSSFTTSRRRSMRSGTSATTIRIVASSLKITQNFLARGWNSR